jgi:uncharacterized protein YndB with AHSA1/START domain
MMITEAKSGVTLFTMPSDTEIVATRTVEAPRGQVWKMSTRPDYLPHWMLGPDEWTMPVCEIDLKPGGAWRYVWRRADGSELEMHGEYREVLAPERLVMTESWGGDWPETLNTLVLTQTKGKTTMVCKVQYPSKRDRDAATATRMKDGWSASYDRLDAYLRTFF